MKKVFVLIFTTCTFYLSSCSPDNPGSPTSGAVSVKYEIVTSVPVLPQSPITSTISYVNGTGQVETSYSFTSGTTWEKQ